MRVHPHHSALYRNFWQYVGQRKGCLEVAYPPLPPPPSFPPPPPPPPTKQRFTPFRLSWCLLHSLIHSFFQGLQQQLKPSLRHPRRYSFNLAVIIYFSSSSSPVCLSSEWSLLYGVPGCGALSVPGDWKWWYLARKGILYFGFCFVDSLRFPIGLRLPPSPPPPPPPIPRIVKDASRIL